MRAAVDTNILAYAEGVNGVERRQAALGILIASPRSCPTTRSQSMRSRRLRGPFAAFCWSIPTPTASGWLQG
jgi:hypothetical protein